MNMKNNRQFQNSDVRMKKALLELMNTTAFEKITVRLICEKAEVNRSTFYAHYTDIRDMIGQMDANLRKKIMEDFPASEKVVPLSLKSLITFLGFIREHRDYYRVILKAKQEFPLKQGFEPLWEQVITPLCLKAGIVSKSEIMYYFVGFQAGFTMIIKRWVEQDCAEREDKIAQIIRNLVPSIWKDESGEM